MLSDILKLINKLQPEEITDLRQILEAIECDELDPIIVRICQDGNKLLAVVTMQNLKQIGLRDAKDEVDRIINEYKIKIEE